MTTNKKAAPARVAQETTASQNSTGVGSSDKITVLESLNLFLTKRYLTDGRTLSYDSSASYHTKEVEVRDLKGVATLLGKLHKNPHRCLIRGKFVGVATAQPGSREGTWARNKANFTDQPLHWFMIDIDAFAPFAADPVLEVEAAVAEFIVKVLPAAFRQASYYWHLSSSAGMPGKEDVLKCHLHFWSKTPYTSNQLRAWAKQTSRLIDSAVFNQVQVHYTADPVFETGRVDPVEVRFGWHQGATDAVDLVLGADLLANVRETGAGSEHGDMRVKDPSEKEGLIGLFHRAFEAEDVLLTLLDEFEQVSQRRYTWLNGGGTPEGVWVHDDNMHIASSHNTWPIDGLANLWDVTRVFKFGELDKAPAGADDFDKMAVEECPVGQRPSDKAMYAWVEGLPEIKEARRDEPDTRSVGQLILSIIARELRRTEDADVLAREIELDVAKIDRVYAALAFNPLNSKFWLVTPRGSGILSTEKDLGRMIREHFGKLLGDIRAAVEDAARRLGTNKGWIDAQVKRLQAVPLDQLTTKTKAHRQMTKAEFEVDMFASEGGMQVSDGCMRLIYTHLPFRAGQCDEGVIADYREHFPQFDDFIELLVASRFASSRKKSHLWFHAESDWGKSFLMQAIKQLGLVIETSVAELEKVMAGGPVGLTLEEFRRIWCLSIDEFKGVSREVKQLSECMAGNWSLNSARSDNWRPYSAHVER